MTIDTRTCLFETRYGILTNKMSTLWDSSQLLEDSISMNRKIHSNSFKYDLLNS